jgi:polysaccharide export outer membrane protein
VGNMYICTRIAINCVAKMFMMKKTLFSLVFICLLFSCAPKERLVYFQGIENMGKANSSEIYQPRLQPDDLLLIIVSAPDPEAAAPYNLVTYSSVDNGERANTGLRYQTYLIDHEGNIEFPVLGSLKIGGLTKGEAINKLKNELKKYINSPIVNMRIMNFKFSVMGEVARPGAYNIQTERITLPEALSMAGDLTIYGDRKHVLVVRDDAGERTSTIVDITDSAFVNSPFYYLDQNDVVYVQPNQTKVNSSVVGPNITVGISALSLIITVFAILSR